jgi:DNA-binding SARP family transcriptional activator
MLLHPVFHEDEVMDMSNDSGEPAQPFPQLRVWLCGPFRMAWIDPISGQALSHADLAIAGRDRAAALMLLALLLCQPNRQAHRDWIMEQFWPEGKRDVAIHRLENIFSTLRKLLRPPSGGESLLHSLLGKKSSGPSYCLAAYPKLWVDIDALTWQVEQACRMERFGDDALPFWERAFDLFKAGPFLADTPYEPYASWITEQREYLQGYARQCVHALTRLYVTTYGEAGKAEALLLLRTYWQQAKTDEDALRPLLELLGEQERYQEAEEYYQQYLEALAELGPDETGQPRRPDARTHDIHEYLRTKQIQRERGILSGLLISTNKAVSLERQPRRSRLDVGNSSHVISASSFYRANDDTMDRREASKKMVSIGATLLTAPHLFGLIELGTMLHNEEILSLIAASLPVCWRLYFDGQLSEVQRVLPGYLSQLAILIREPSRYQRQAASCASKAHQLACMLALQQQDYGFALIHADQALFAASIAEDTHLLVASLIRKALVYRYLKRFKLMLETYQEADQYSEVISPLLQGRLYTGLAEAHSNFEREYEAQHFLERAYITFPENPRDDPNFSYTHFKLPQGFEAVMYLNLKQAEKAWSVLSKIDASVPTAIVPDRVELSVDQARASLLLDDMTQSCKYVEFAATAASALGSHLRYNEAYNLYQQIQMQWPREQQVKALAGHFQ